MFVHPKNFKIWTTYKEAIFNFEGYVMLPNILRLRRSITQKIKRGFCNKNLHESKIKYLFFFSPLLASTHPYTFLIHYETNFEKEKGNCQYLSKCYNFLWFSISIFMNITKMILKKEMLWIPIHLSIPAKLLLILPKPSFSLR